MPQPNKKNPFKAPSRHPVEECLYKVHEAMEEFDNGHTMKIYRQMALEYLENQYQRIFAASTSKHLL
jgi:hypothetical protein